MRKVFQATIRSDSRRGGRGSCRRASHKPATISAEAMTRVALGCVANQSMRNRHASGPRATADNVRADGSVQVLRHQSLACRRNSFTRPNCRIHQIPRIASSVVLVDMIRNAPSRLVPQLSRERVRLGCSVRNPRSRSAAGTTARFGCSMQAIDLRRSPRGALVWTQIIRCGSGNIGFELVGSAYGYSGIALLLFPPSTAERGLSESRKKRDDISSHSPTAVISICAVASS